MYHSTIIDDACSIVIGPVLWDNLLKELNKHRFSKFFVLTDENTHKDCLPYLNENLGSHIDYEVYTIPAGEINKTLKTCEEVWTFLAEHKADRNSLLINLGGGMLCDLGGFVASTYMRGIKWVNIPTSLLSMVDASVGGKTGIDFHNLKNIIGVIRNPIFVGIDLHFLQTLNSRERRAGYAEMLKHALLSDQKHWDELTQLTWDDIDKLSPLVHKSVSFKQQIVAQDRDEQNIRKQLNLGHTIGHAVESFFLNSGNPILHGEAVAAGLIMELYLASKLCDFPLDKRNMLVDFIVRKYGVISIDDSDLEEIINYMFYDKKNKEGRIQFVLLEDIGQVVYNQEVNYNLILKAFAYYKSLIKNNEKH